MWPICRPISNRLSAIKIGMHPGRRFAKTICFLLCAAAVILFASLAQRPAPIPMPPLVLWAWERPEDLRFIDPATTGVAYLAATVNLQLNGTTQYHFRLQPLRVPVNASLTAVVRIESPPRYTFPDPAAIAAGLAQIAQHPKVKALQIDFDARVSERTFYRAILSSLRRQTALPVGITALASWCTGDPWLEGQALSESIPMFFRMGPTESKDMPVKEQGCRNSIGLSTDEAWPAARPAGLSNTARVYVFNPHAWTKVDYDATVRRIEHWK
jgi:hypothetical protein